MKNIQNSEHTFIAGKTGSGKSFLTYYYLSGFPYVRVLDIKGLFNPVEFSPDFAIVPNFADLSAAAAENPYIIYRPNFEELTDFYYNEFFKWCYYSGNCTVCVDELMGVYDTPHKALPFHKAILTRGRELNINIFDTTQRPSGVPLLTMSEATHFFIFDLNLKVDREKIAGITGQENFLEPPGKYTFWYYNFSMSEPQKGKLKIM